MHEVGPLSDGTRLAGYRPECPTENRHPVFQWPPRPGAFAKWLLGFPGFLWPWQTFFIGVSFACWQFLTPGMETMRHFSAGWIAWIFAVNLALVTLFVSIWHVWLYTFKAQGTNYKYNSKWLSADDPNFLFHSQLWDNVFWTFVSAVPILTAYEVLTFWLQANGFIPTIEFQKHPVYCVLLLLITPLWTEFYFYWTHRLIHWRPLYQSIHRLHHKNLNFGPWSGLAMHPVEHLIFFSSVIILWVVPSHPLHALYLLQTLALGPALTHHGFGRLVLGKKTTFDSNHYMHYLHHKHVQCNYGDDAVPLDRWFGTFHDGSDKANAALKERMRARALRSRRKTQGA